MKIICKKIDSKGLNLKEVTTILSNEFDFSDGGRGLELNSEYDVLGMVIYKDSPCLYYLIDVYGRPDWFPYLLFDISDNSLPMNWFSNVYVKITNVNIYAIWGFNELCNDENFYDQLMDRDDMALQVYFKRKQEIE